MWENRSRHAYQGLHLFWDFSNMILSSRESKGIPNVSLPLSGHRVVKAEGMFMV
jgi:hypothetical protein